MNSRRQFLSFIAASPLAFAADNLITNPKTTLDVTLHMLPMINVMDLKKLTMNKNIPETLRTAAFKLQRTRADQKK